MNFVKNFFAEKFAGKKFLKVPTKAFYFSSDVITHLQMYQELTQKTMLVAKFIGVNIFDSNYKVLNARFVTGFALFFFSTIINIYDIYLFRNDLVRSMFCMITLCSSVQCVTKYYSFLIKMGNCRELKNRAEKFHQNFKTIKSAEIFEKWMIIAAHVGAILTVMYFCALILIVSYPAIFLIFLNERVLPFGIELPMLDWKESWIGYGLNYFYHSLILTFFVFASIASIFVVICYLASLFAQFEMLSVLIADLNELALKNGKGENNFVIKNALREIIKLHLELIE
jgi:hypothetical protein